MRNSSSQEEDAHTRSRRPVFNWRRWEIYALLAGVLAIVGLFVIEPLWLEFKLNREATHFGTPAGMHRDSRVKTGDFLCVITCEGSVVTMEFTTAHDTDATCTTVRRHMKARGYELLPYDPAIWTPPGSALCSFNASVRRVRHGARVTAAVFPAETGARVEVRVDANNG